MILVRIIEIVCCFSIAIQVATHFVPVSLDTYRTGYKQHLYTENALYCTHTLPEDSLPTISQYWDFENCVRGQHYRDGKIEILREHYEDRIKQDDEHSRDGN